MCTRLFSLSVEDLYKQFNMHDPRWPNNLPPPPNPDRLQQFYFAIADVTVSQLNKENGGDDRPPSVNAQGRPPRRRV